MKIKKVLITFFYLSLLILTVKANIESIPFKNLTPSQKMALNIKTIFEDNIYRRHSLGEEMLDARQASFHKSMCSYIKTIYNDPNYSEFLSQNGSHIIELLDLCQELKISKEIVTGCIRLFYNKLKFCEIIDATVITQLLRPLPNILADYFEEEELPLELSFYKLTEDIILSKFSDEFNYFTNNPINFIEDLSKNIATTISNKAQTYLEEKELTERLRQTIIKFFESAISKTLWDDSAPESIWPSVLLMANGIENLAEKGIINHSDDMDDLLWSLVSRFVFFLEIRGSTLPPEFYENIESDIENKIVFFLEREEMDEGIKTKKEILVEALANAKAKAIAYQKGIISDLMV